jgi:SAM-dependent methyltransferase
MPTVVTPNGERRKHRRGSEWAAARAGARRDSSLGGRPSTSYRRSRCLRPRSTPLSWDRILVNERHALGYGRKDEIRRHFDRIAPERRRWIERNRYFYDVDRAYMTFLIPAGHSVLELGCGTGDLLSALRPSRGVGVDVSVEMVRIARERHPTFTFHVGNAEDDDLLAAIDGPFDFIVLSDVIGYLEDCEATFAALRRLCAPRTRLVIAYYSRLWEPVLALGERLGQKMPSLPQNWLSTDDIANLLRLADFEVIRREWRQIVPKRFLGVGPLANRYLGTMPGIRRLSLRDYVVARPLFPGAHEGTQPSCSVVIPCRNERGNIESAVRRLPDFAPRLEILFVEGHSRDGTYEECVRVRDAYPDRNIRVMRQAGRGKGDAVHLGFAAATGDVVMILDADLTVPPELLPKFYRALVANRGEFVNGTRMVYPMSERAMRRLNFVANRAFAIVFSYLLNQRFTDTLCGTKALWRRDYAEIAANRSYFGELDPFGDFDLIFGAAKLNLKIVEVPVRYGERLYGETQISRFSHGWLLLRMVLLAWRKLKAV